MNTWKALGYMTLGVLFVGALVNMHDIKRYIRISRM